MKDSLSKFKRATPKEHKLFGKTSYTYFTTAIVNSTGGLRALSPILYWYDNIVSKIDHIVWGQRDSYAVLNGYFGENYQKGVYPNGNDTSKVQTNVVYLMGKEPIDPRHSSRDKERLVKSIQSTAAGIGASEVHVRDLITWKYFPRYSPEDMERKILWDIVKYQGKKNMWYLGSSVIFESVKSVIEYNKMMVKNMKKPMSGNISK